MMIKWSFQKLTNVKKKRIKISYKSCFILIPAMHLILLYGNQKSKKTWATTQDLHKIVGATTLQAVGYTSNDGKGETNCL